MDLPAEDPAVTRFREYIRIRTVQPEPDYHGAILFLQKMADDIGLPYKAVEVAPNRIVFIMTWEGIDPSLPSIMLNSHIDVVPVDADHWTVDPFSAHKMESGDIYGRGTQDMKSVGIQYLEAVRHLKAKGQKMLRTIHITFVPDEEIGGKLGMRLFVEHDEFKKLNIGFALDEGLANPTETFTVFYGERCPWWVKVKCPGNPGHGSRFIENNAAEKFQKIINSFLEFRDKEEKRLNADSSLKLGDVTSINLTMVTVNGWNKFFRQALCNQGGLQPNVIPSELSAVFDIRLTPTTNFEEFEALIQKWCQEAGKDVTYEFKQKQTLKTVTRTDRSSPWWNAFSSVFESMKLKIETEIFPAATDARYLRALSFPALGFSPMNHTPILLHDHDEFLNEGIFLRGIDIYCQLILALASVPNHS